jgi:hypothetical protein
MGSVDMSGPLAGIRALDLGTYAIGPSACAYLGQLGAEVIRIENPAGEAFMDFEPTMNGMATSYINSNMAKKSIYLNLKEPDDLEVARRLAGTADVVVENRLPGVIERLGLGYEVVSRVNPSKMGRRSCFASMRTLITRLDSFWSRRHCSGFYDASEPAKASGSKSAFSLRRSFFSSPESQSIWRLARRPSAKAAPAR